MPARNTFEYAVIRIVPRVERGEFINAGVVLFCRARRFLRAHIEIDAERLTALAPDLDIPTVAEQLGHFPLICKGGAGAGPIGVLPQFERFRWLVAPRSTIIQPSPVHCGLCGDPEEALQRLVATMINLPAARSP